MDKLPKNWWIALWGLILLILPIIFHFLWSRLFSDVQTWEILDISIAYATYIFAWLFWWYIHTILSKKNSNLKIRKEIKLETCSKIQTNLERLTTLIEKACLDPDKDKSDFINSIISLDRRIGVGVERIKNDAITNILNTYKISLTDNIKSDDFSFNSQYQSTAIDAINKMDTAIEDKKYQIAEE